MFDPSVPTPDMKIDVSLGEFHSTHDAAYAAKKLIAGGLDKLSIDQLNDALSKFRAGQRLTDAEDGPDFMFASSYWDEIKLVQEELKRRNETSRR